MKNWADHCSSDEESVEGIDDVVEKVEAQTLGDEEAAAETEEVVDESRETHGRRTGPRTYDFPDRPPFTAFIGNLAYSLKDPEDLKAAVAKCAAETLGQELNIVGARIALDRDGKHRGFGYIELETLDELKMLMQLNDSQGTVGGRKVQVDTSNGKQNGRKNHQRRSNGGDVDGSNFRGGKFGSRNKDDSTPAERPSLKLAPRTKKSEDGEKAAGSTNIFGGAKARDASAWEERKKPNNSDRRQSAQTGRGRGSRGGGGSRGEVGGRDGGRDRRGPQERRKPEKKLISPEERAAAAKAAAEAAAPAPAAKPQPPANKFALLMDSDSE